MLPFDITPDQDSVFIDAMNSNGGDATAACVVARIMSPMYPIDYIAKLMMERPEIQAALGALKLIKKNSVMPEITRDSIVADMQSVYEKAMLLGDPKAAIASKRLQSELLKFLDQSITITHKTDASQLTDEELMRIASKRTIEGDFKNVTPADATIGNLPARTA